MLLSAMPSRGPAPADHGHPAINRINVFLASPNFIVVVMLLTMLSNLFGLELPVYTLFVATAVYVCLWGGDLLPLMPMVIACYVAPSAANNPGRNEASVFSGATGIYLGCLAGVLALAILYRVIRDRQRFLGRKYTLLSGTLILLFAYLISGVGSQNYSQRAMGHLFFALLQGLVIVLPYVLFCGGVDWEKVKKDYFAWIGFSLGGVLVVQILWIYLSTNVVIDGIIDRDNIFTGWGMYNNMGGLLAMMIPFAFYLATKYRRGWIGTVVGSAFLVCVFLTCSRSSILTGTAIHLLCVVLMLHYARNRRGNTIAIISFVSVTVLITVLFRGQILRLFSGLLDHGLNPSSRDVIYREGLEIFKQYPLFGGSFFSPGYEPWGWSTNQGFTAFFPPRWHNTIVQLLAGSGVVGLGAYLFHRVQTVKLLLTRHSKEKTFIACALGVLLAGSLFDCHFFNLGPVLFYSMALAFGENCHLGKR